MENELLCHDLIQRKRMLHKKNSWKRSVLSLNFRCFFKKMKYEMMKIDILLRYLTVKLSLLTTKTNLKNKITKTNFYKFLIKGTPHSVQQTV